MRYHHSRFVAPRALVLLVALTVGCERTLEVDPPVEVSLDAQLRQAIGVWGVMPIGNPPAQTAAMVDLGQALFFDKLLSGNRDVACATCHEPGVQLIDGLSLPVGTGGSGMASARVLGPGREFVPRNAPSLLNQGLGFVYTLWDGRVNEEGFFGQPQNSTTGQFKAPPGVVFPPGLTNLVAAQAMLPVLSRVEMRGKPGDVDVFGNPNELAAIHDTNEQAVWKGTMDRLLAVQGYVAKFNAAFPGIPTSALGFQHAANAIAAFEIASYTRTKSPFDRYLARDNSALTEDEKRGALLFFGNQARCSQCHNGALLGGQQFANIGVPQIGPGVGTSAPLDIGRAENLPGGPTQNSFYKFSFRVPALRNVELTAPYMHNGAFRTLETVVRHYTNPDSSLRNYDVTQLDAPLRSLHRGDQTTVNAVAATIDGRLSSFGGGTQGRVRLNETERAQIVAFLKSLTDPAAKSLMGTVPASVPSGLPVR